LIPTRTTSSGVVLETLTSGPMKSPPSLFITVSHKGAAIHGMGIKKISARSALFTKFPIRYFVKIQGQTLAFSIKFDDIFILPYYGAV
jgi:hypothetical protein